MSTIVHGRYQYFWALNNERYILFINLNRISFNCFFTNVHAKENKNNRLYRCRYRMSENLCTILKFIFFFFIISDFILVLYVFVLFCGKIMGKKLTIKGKSLIGFVCLERWGNVANCSWSCFYRNLDAAWCLIRRADLIKLILVLQVLNWSALLKSPHHHSSPNFLLSLSEF